MENVSKALIIAGTVLLAGLLIAMFVRLFQTGGELGATYDKKQQAEQLELYNAQFEFYDKKNNTIMDMISVANLAYSINKDCGYDPTLGVSITIKANNKQYQVLVEEENLTRNQIKVDGTIISTYDLLTKSLGDLGITTGSDEKLTETKYQDKKTIYKYVFSCVKIGAESNPGSGCHNNGKVSNMEFKLIQNPEW